MFSFAMCLFLFIYLNSCSVSIKLFLVVIHFLLAFIISVTLMNVDFLNVDLWPIQMFLELWICYKACN